MGSFVSVHSMGAIEEGKADFFPFAIYRSDANYAP